MTSGASGDQPTGDPKTSLAAVMDEYAASVCPQHPDALGEVLRAWAFVGEGTGCYSTFDVRPDREEIELIRWFKHPNGIEMGWHWDGDGCLAFFVPELADEDYTGAVTNGDCKKDYGWRFDERRTPLPGSPVAKPQSNEEAVVLNQEAGR